MAKPQTENGTDYVFGAKVEFGTFTLDSDTVSGNSELESTLAFSGVSTDSEQDQIFLNSREMDGFVLLKEARVTGDDEIGVNLMNVGSTDVNPGSITFDYMVFKFKDA